ncbi:PREDICTED: cytochrome P450 CYP82D47 [Theobroma cacao]|uniref:Cytochrome P450 CYP82D47 n=1 Tax=Theobroma cacao TaxID=3641 RepID=A0AB32VVK6_THECC|nr:PREDICTED: cytochrome P450 CYP82D47 [Theobroma cacao]
MVFSSHLFAIAGFLGLVLFYKLWKKGTPSHQRKGILLAPEPPGALPIIGHIHLLGGKRTLAQTLGAMADKYGPIFSIRFGAFPALIISNHEAVKECFTTNDRVLASRPKSNAGTYLGYDHAGFGFAPYGEYWRETRKLAVVELLSSHRLETSKHVLDFEVNAFIKNLYLFCKKNGPDANPKAVISHKFEALTLNTITRMIAGKRYISDGEEEDDVEARHVIKVIKDFMYVSGLIAPSEAMPFLGWMESIFGGPVKSMKRVAKEIDSIIGRWVDEHKLKRLMSEADHNNQDFIDLLLSAIGEDSMFGYTRETIIKATVMNLFLAGADTTSIALTWILSNLMNNRHTLKTAQEELDLKVGRDKWVQDSDIEKLVYLQAVIKETLRLYPPGPISVPHEAREVCSISGYHVQKGTRVIVNLRRLHRDPRIWSNPDEFQPERFLTSHANVDVLGQHFELIPFGSGRRSCPGMPLALQITHLTIARTLQGFDLTTPFNESVDMTEGLGITMPKATPLDVLLSPRLPAALYLQL